MALYDSQSDVTAGVPKQWQDFRLTHPSLDDNSSLYGASPCTGDGKTHYLTGVEHGSLGGTINGERSERTAGEYACLVSMIPPCFAISGSGCSGTVYPPLDVERRMRRRLSG